MENHHAIHNKKVTINGDVPSFYDYSHHVLGAPHWGGHGRSHVPLHAPRFGSPAGPGRARRGRLCARELSNGGGGVSGSMGPKWCITEPNNYYIYIYIHSFFYMDFPMEILPIPSALHIFSGRSQHQGEPPLRPRAEGEHGTAAAHGLFRILGM